jgi:hypothetical protein
VGLVKLGLSGIVTLVFAAGGVGCGGSIGNGSDGGNHDATFACGDQGDRCCGIACNAGLTCIGGQCVVSPAADAATESSSMDEAGADDSGRACASDPSCGGGTVCCQGHCVDPTNDPTNCGACGVACEVGSYCAPSTRSLTSGSCQQDSCVTGNSCDAGTSCCGNYCCSPGQICCVAGNSGGPPQGTGDLRYCLTPSTREPTCAPGCPLCR